MKDGGERYYSKSAVRDGTGLVNQLKDRWDDRQIYTIRREYCTFVPQ